MVHHIYKYHVPLERCPYYCTLCLFRSVKKRDLDRHVRGYQPHRRLASDMGKENDPGDFLKQSKTPFVVSDKDLVRLTREESEAIWKSRERGTKPVSLFPEPPRPLVVRLNPSVAD